MMGGASKGEVRKVWEEGRKERVGGGRKKEERVDMDYGGRKENRKGVGDRPIISKFMVFSEST